ncbi:plasmid replication initiator protein RepA (plasmid) [Frigidibacter mobilis]|uniref:Plasmid replication initiator protein RepA n=1 Tax=Frigidibacter mobilis TaxID=1335048 RepID=A0A159Z9A7_9RHOB|nr:plasmid replication initiator protein RepA [Frigidibacter mobilis]
MKGPELRLSATHASSGLGGALRLLPLHCQAFAAFRWRDVERLEGAFRRVIHRLCGQGGCYIGVRVWVKGFWQNLKRLIQSTESAVFCHSWWVKPESWCLIPESWWVKPEYVLRCLKPRILLAKVPETVAAYAGRCLIPRKSLTRVGETRIWRMVSETPNLPVVQDALLPERHPQYDLFICDVADAVLKDVMPQMEHPFYSLSKKPETSIRLYEHNGQWIKVIPSVKGLATIYDKDILIYCISQIMAKLKNGEPVSKRVRINSRDLLVFTNRGTAGKDYEALQEALERIRGTTISTNIRTGKEEQTDTFGLIDASSIRRQNGLDGRLLSCEITLSDWVFNAIKSNEVLTLHRDYFRLRKPIERRIYELAASIAASNLHGRCRWISCSRNLARSRRRRSSAARCANWPPAITSRLSGVFRRHGRHGDVHQPEHHEDRGEDEKGEPWSGRLDQDIHNEVRRVAPGWDPYHLEGHFREWLTEEEIIPRTRTRCSSSSARRGLPSAGGRDGL